MFRRVLVANRGEIAVRVIRALHELGIEAVAIYSTADSDALHVRMADHAVRVGPPTASESYLRIPSVIAAAETTGCEAVHPGYGFLAENPAFVEACVDNDLVFIGPPADVMALMGDKISAKQAMRAADVPTVPGTEGATSLVDVRGVASDIGFPLLLKATAGGGGKGMRLVTEPGDLEDAYRTASTEAEAAFGDGTMYVEKALVPARHVEILAYLRLGRPREALSDLAQAESLMPGETASLHFPRGNAYMSLGDDAHAVEEFGRAIEAREGGADAYVNRGLARMRLGDRSGAGSDFREALRLDPNHAEAQAQLLRLAPKAP
ncbi:MAG TPA: biotin carboxylase N-terminal domain-containing protein [Candidatus Eisenbacteria bacterium]|nr:biotin carboxylase N-terminal domain-containing protein [Candidatus Eisenbacteria bacterium]